VRSVLQLLADTSGQNIVVSDSVTGNLTLRLQNVPWDQALDIVLRTKGLDKRRQDNVIIIGADRGTRLAREGRTGGAQGSAGTVARCAVRVPAGQLRQGRGPRQADQAAGRQRRRRRPTPCCRRAAASVHRRAHQHLLVQDTAERLADIRRLVQTLDVPVKQVLIEARIVVVSDTFERDLGASSASRPTAKNGQPTC
jgi:type IV pilus assembly protein PilQ